MSFFTNRKFLFKLIATLCVCLTIFNFILTPRSNAASELSALGGQLLDPIVDLILVLGDGIMEIIHKSIMGTPAGLIFNNETSWLDVIKTALKVVMSVIIGLCAVAFIGWLAAFIPFVGPILAAGLTSGIIGAVANAAAVYIAYSAISADDMPDNIFLPSIHISPEEIFLGQILLFDVNIFNPKTVMVELEKEDSSTEVMTVEEYNEKKIDDTSMVQDYKVKRYYYDEDKNGDGTIQEDDGERIVTSVNNSAYELKSNIAKWYYTIRNIALIGLMLVLIYVGIKMLTSSIASEKAKYQQMLGDWLVAICLIFVMHYFMVFLNVFVDNVVNMLSTIAEANGDVTIIEDADKLAEELKNQGYSEDLLPGNGQVVWETNQIGRFRFEAQRKDGTAAYVGYAICYLVLVFFTVLFTFTYLKRLLYVLFLTVIAPFVAMTYPIDKIKDGKAQAFEMWMKEYVYNLIIQPFHLLLYIIFISMAYDIAGQNVVYSLVVIGFMIPAEKFLRKMFGFDKASSPGFLAGAAGVAMTMTAMKSLGSFANSGKKEDKKTGGGNDKIKESQNDFLDRSANSGNGLPNLLDDAVAEGQQGNNTGRNEPEENNPGGNGQEGDSGEPNPGEQNPNDLLDENDPNDNTYIGPSNNQREPIDDGNNNPDPEPEPQIDPEPVDNSSKKPKSYLGTAFRNNFRKNISGSHIKNMAGKTFTKGVKDVAKITMGSAGAAIGLAAGIANGSPGDALKYGISGMYAGSAIGSGLSNRGISFVSGISENVKNQHEEIQKTRYGSDYKKMINQKKDEEFKKDAEMRKLYADKFGLTKKADIDKVMNEAVEFRKYGITDNSLIMKAMSLDKNNKASKQNIAAARLSTIAKTQEDLDKAMERYARSGASQPQIDKMRENIEQINF